LIQPGGTTLSFSKSQIKQKEKSAKSIMPALASSMSQQELIDLVSFLESLKKIP
jgi:hypothetical protein